MGNGRSVLEEPLAFLIIGSLLAWARAPGSIDTGPHKLRRCWPCSQDAILSRTGVHSGNLPVTEVPIDDFACSLACLPAIADRAVPRTVYHVHQQMAAVRIKAAIARSCRSVMQLTRSICYLETLVKWETPPVRSAYEKIVECWSHATKSLQCASFVLAAPASQAVFPTRREDDETKP